MSVAEAAVLIKANAAAMDPGIRSAESRLSGFASRATSILAGVGVGLSFSAVISQSQQFAASVEDLSENLGISAESASALNVAAARVGVGSEAMHTSMVRMLQTLGKARREGGEAAEAFARIGLSAQALSSMDSGEAFTQIITRLGAIPNYAERAAASMAIFGKGWTSIGDVIRGGSAGLEDARRLAQQLGLSLSTADVSGAKAMSVAWNELKLAAVGFGNMLGKHLFPILRPVLGIIRDFVSTFGGFILQTAAAAGAVWLAVKAFYVFRVALLHALAAQMALQVGLISLKTTLIRTGIGALIVALGFVIAHFASTSEAAETTEHSIESIGTTAAASAETLRGLAGMSLRELTSEAEKLANTFLDQGANAAGVNKELVKLIQLRAQLAAAMAAEQGVQPVTPAFSGGSSGFGEAAGQSSAQLQSLQTQVGAANQTFQFQQNAQVIASLEAMDNALARAAATAGMSQEEIQLYNASLVQTVSIVNGVVRVVESATTPFDRFHESISVLEGQLASGALSQDAFNNAMSEALGIYRQQEELLERVNERLEEQAQWQIIMAIAEREAQERQEMARRIAQRAEQAASATITSPSAMTRGSVEAQSFINEFQNKTAKIDRSANMEQIARQELASAQRQERLLEEANRVLERIERARVGVI